MKLSQDIPQTLFIVSREMTVLQNKVLFKKNNNPRLQSSSIVIQTRSLYIIFGQSCVIKFNFAVVMARELASVRPYGSFTRSPLVT